MKKHVFLLIAVLLIAVMVSPAWAGQRHKKAAWEQGIYRFLCRSSHPLAVRSRRAFRGLIEAARRSPVIHVPTEEPDPVVVKTDPNTDGGNSVKK